MFDSKEAYLTEIFPIVQRKNLVKSSLRVQRNVFVIDFSNGAGILCHYKFYDNT